MTDSPWMRSLPQNEYGSPSHSARGRATRVLHVSEAFGGGIAASLHGMVANAPDVEHIVLALPHRRHFGSTERFGDVTFIDSGERVPIARAVEHVARAYREWRPDVVHAHSSYAGVYVRMVPQIPTSAIVYTPHCFAFERTDLSRPKASFLRLVERLLVPRTGVLLAVSEHEGRLAETLSKNWQVIRAINAPQVPDPIRGAARSPGPSERIVVATIGRVCNQKDPAYFSRVVRMAKDRGVDVDWMWIGDGAPEMRRQLEEVGVLVKGWQDRESTLHLLSSCHIYLHTAAWEVGMPLTVFEAAAIGLPLVVRSLASMDDVRIPTQVDSPVEAAREIERLCGRQYWSEQSAVVKQAFASLAVDQKLADSLAEAYDLCVRRTDVEPSTSQERDRTAGKGAAPAA
jgi:glycosyltransferase involved in cell wall biosynthesis